MATNRSQISHRSNYPEELGNVTFQGTDTKVALKLPLVANPVHAAVTGNTSKVRTTIAGQHSSP